METNINLYFLIACSHHNEKIQFCAITYSMQRWNYVHLPKYWCEYIIQFTSNKTHPTVTQWLIMDSQDFSHFWHLVWKFWANLYYTWYVRLLELGLSELKCVKCLKSFPFKSKAITALIFTRYLESAGT